MMDHDKMKNYN